MTFTIPLWLWNTAVCLGYLALIVLAALGVAFIVFMSGYRPWR